jgi:hypothetical protein
MPLSKGAQPGTAINVGLVLPAPPKLPKNERSDVLEGVSMVPPASLRLRAGSIGQTGRFARPSFGAVAKCAQPKMAISCALTRGVSWLSSHAPVFLPEGSRINL